MNIITETQRLFLREFMLTDSAAAYHLNADLEVLKYTGDIPFKDEGDALDFLINYIPTYKINGMGRWAVIRKEDNAFCGWCGLKRNEDGQIDLGYRLMRKYWGKGIASEAAKAALDYGFESLDLDRIIARAHKANIGSIRIMQKLKMSFVKELILDNQPGVLYEKIKLNSSEKYQ